MSPVKDDAAAHRFELAVGDATAFIEYRQEGGQTVLIHTEVPETLEGQGVGSALVRGTLELLRGKGQAVVPQCSFVARYIERHPEYRDLVAGG